MKADRIQTAGIHFVATIHYIALFAIAITVAWSAIWEYWQIMDKGYADLKDILLLFIYIELSAMIGIYFKTQRLPVQILIFIAITALSRHLVIDVQYVAEIFHLQLLLAIVTAILMLSMSLFIISYTANKFGRPEDRLMKKDSEKS